MDLPFKSGERHLSNRAVFYGNREQTNPGVTGGAAVTLVLTRARTWRDIAEDLGPGLRRALAARTLSPVWSITPIAGANIALAKIRANFDGAAS